MKVVRKIGEISFKGLSLICFGASKALGYVSDIAQKLSDKCKSKEESTE